MEEKGNKDKRGTKPEEPKRRRRGLKQMPTKELNREETLAGNSLRSLSQKSLLELVQNHEKLGLIVNNNIEIAMLSWDRYEEIVEVISEQQEKLEELTSIIEDLQLAKHYGQDVVRAETDRTKAFEIEDVDDLFDRLD